MKSINNNLIKSKSIQRIQAKIYAWMIFLGLGVTYILLTIAVSV